MLKNQIFKEGTQLSFLPAQHPSRATSPPASVQLPPPLCLSRTMLTSAPPTAKPVPASGPSPVPLLLPRTSCPRCRALSPPFRPLSGITRERPPAPVWTMLPRAPLLCSLRFMLITCLSPWTPCVSALFPRKAHSEAGPQEASRMYARGPTEGTDGRSAGRLRAVDPYALGWRPGRRAPADSRFRAGERLILLRPRNTTSRLFNIQSASNSLLLPLGTT